MTSELRADVSSPIAAFFSRTMTSRPASASSRAIARPTTPAPMTTVSVLSLIACVPRPENERGFSQPQHYVSTLELDAGARRSC